MAFAFPFLFFRETRSSKTADAEKEGFDSRGGDFVFLAEESYSIQGWIYLVNMCLSCRETENRKVSSSLFPPFHSTTPNVFESVVRKAVSGLWGADSLRTHCSGELSWIREQADTRCGSVQNHHGFPEARSPPTALLSLSL